MNTPTLVSNLSTIRKSVFLLTLAGLLSVSSVSFAAGACKGMEKDTCSSESSCSWINSYTTKKGKTINAYCRNKSKSNKSKSVPDSSSAGKTDKQG
jgi:hypothetical protein